MFNAPFTVLAQPPRSADVAPRSLASPGAFLTNQSRKLASLSDSTSSGSRLVVTLRWRLPLVTTDCVPDSVFLFVSFFLCKTTSTKERPTKHVQSALSFTLTLSFWLHYSLPALSNPLLVLCLLFLLYSLFFRTLYFIFTFPSLLLLFLAFVFSVFLSFCVFPFQISLVIVFPCFVLIYTCLTLVLSL